MISQKDLKEMLKLKSRKFRKERKRFIVEGIRSIEELVNSDWEVGLLLYSVLTEKNVKAENIFQKARKKNIRIERVNQNIINKITETVTSAGVICIAKTKELSVDGLLKKEPKTIIALDEIKDPGNLGTLIRTADAAGIDGVILSEKTVELYGPKVVRSSMGSIFHLPIVKETNLVQSIKELKKKRFRIIASAIGRGEVYNRADYSGRVCLVVGNEIDGVREELLKLADQIVNIPLYGKAESLNASVAGGILMYQIMKDKT